MRAALLGAALLAGCAAPEPQPVAVAPPAPQPEPAPLVDPTAETVRLQAPSSIARDRVERLAASCWLDAELAAEIMLVDRHSGAIVATDATGEVLRIAFAPAGPLDTDVTLTGAAMADADRSARMTDALSRALEGPVPAC